MGFSSHNVKWTLSTTIDNCMFSSVSWFWNIIWASIVESQALILQWPYPFLVYVYYIIILCIIILYIIIYIIIYIFYIYILHYYDIIYYDYYILYYYDIMYILYYLYWIRYYALRILGMLPRIPLDLGKSGMPTKLIHEWIWPGIPLEKNIWL